MRKLLLTAATAAALAATTGCYHAVVTTGKPAGTETVSRPWAHSFINGLVPPSVTETAQKCPNGVAQVETKMSFVNLLAGAATFGIYSPMTIVATCAR